MSQLLSNLPTGAKVKFGSYQVNSETAQPIIWRVVAKNHSGYPTNAITLHTAGIIDSRCFDAQEPTYPNPDRQWYGNNRYSVANIDQWLNSNAAANAWYAARHTYDQSPDTSDRCGGYGTQYAARPGFLNLFTTAEQNAILTTSLRVVKPSVDGGSYENIARKVFLPSTTEAGLGNEINIAEGYTWGYYTSDALRIAYLTQQAFTNTLSTDKPSAVTTPWFWWLRTPEYLTVYKGRRVGQNGSQSSNGVCYGDGGVRPALNLSSSLLVSDSTDSDGCYTVVWNAPPTKPSSINVPASIYGGRTASISWGASTDPDGNLAGYILQRSVNDGDWTEVYRNNALSYTDSITLGWTTVAYRVRAYDTVGAQSQSETSAIRNVINNQPPVISGADGSLGIKSDVFSQTYSVTDAESDVVTVQELIDDVEIRSHVVTLDAINTFQVTGDAWLRLSNGTHTLKIKAADTANNTSVRIYTFTKSVNSFTIQNTTPYTATECPTRIKIYVTREIPAGAAFEVKVCNNGFDDTPVWEDATAAVENNLVYVFTNQVKTAPNWGVNVKVSVSRGTGEGACYVYQIGGNFDGKTGTAEPGGEGDLTNYYDKTETDDLLEDKQDKLTAGDDVTITDNIISAPSIVFTVTIPVSAWDSGQAVVNNGNFVLTGVDSTEAAYYVDPETPPEIKLKSVAQNSGTFEHTGAVPSAPVTIKIERRFVKAV